jgi:hypothetical protein
MDGFFVIMKIMMNLNGLEPLKDPKKMETDGLRCMETIGL